MILTTKDLQDVATKILTSVDDSALAELTETVELVTRGQYLYFNITNKEYYLSIKFKLDGEENLHATVNANVFLKLINKITTTNIELTVEGTNLIVKGNGKYTIPMTADKEGNLLNIPTIELDNVVTEMAIPSSILNSLITYNSKQIPKNPPKAVHKMYYLDEQGCITYCTTGGCVNNFTLAEPIRLLLNDRLVKLLKLFKTGDVHFELAYDALSDTITQTKVLFACENVLLTAITGCTDALLNEVPVKGIRDRANKVYPYSVVVSKKELSDALDRLLIFNSALENSKPYSKFDFTPEGITLIDYSEAQKEKISYFKGTSVENYSMTLDISDVKKILESCAEDYVTMNFGDNKACVIVRANVRNVTPECKKA